MIKNRKKKNEENWVKSITKVKDKFFVCFHENTKGSREHTKKRSKECPHRAYKKDIAETGKERTYM